MHSLVRLTISLGIGLAAHAAHAAAIEYRRVWTFPPGGGVANLSVANLVAYDAKRGRVYAGGRDKLYTLNMADGTPLVDIPPVVIDTAEFSAITSVAAHGDFVAISVAAADPKTRKMGQV